MVIRQVYAAPALSDTWAGAPWGQHLHLNPPRGAAAGGSTVGRRPIGEGSRRNEYVPTVLKRVRATMRKVYAGTSTCRPLHLDTRNRRRNGEDELPEGVAE